MSSITLRKRNTKNAGISTTVERLLRGMRNLDGKRAQLQGNSSARLQDANTFKRKIARTPGPNRSLRRGVDACQRSTRRDHMVTLVIILVAELE
mmetsp:Transcript_56284/g.150442  ORF Transcript_56284/g.150442 Transcript_56284/m.150442 type:complete len:94 (-) Transcript_56284:1880-2161(-)